ncbi:hypothetical protein [Nonomuraea sp. GTA35]
MRSRLRFVEPLRTPASTPGTGPADNAGRRLVDSRTHPTPLSSSVIN